MRVSGILLLRSAEDPNPILFLRLFYNFEYIRFQFTGILPECVTLVELSLLLRSAGQG